MDFGKNILKIISDSSEIYKNACEKIVSKSQEISGQLSASDIVNKSKNNCLIIKSLIGMKQDVMSMVKGLFIKESELVEYYHIVDADGNIRYKGKYKYLTLLESCENSYTLTIELCDKDDNVVGYIKDIKHKNREWFDKNVRRCSIYRDDKKLCDFKKYEMSDEVHYSFEYSNYSVYDNKLNSYEFKLAGKQIAKLYITQMKKEERYFEQYVLEYQNEKDEIVGILLAIALNTIKD